MNIVRIVREADQSIKQERWLEDEGNDVGKDNET